MTDSFLVLRNGCGPWAYVGTCDLPEAEVNTRLKKEPIVLEGAYMLYTVTVPLGPGKIAQESHIFPIDNALEKIDRLAIVADSAYRPTDTGQRQIRKMIDACEGFLTQARSGLVSPHH